MQPQTFNVAGVRYRMSFNEIDTAQREAALMSKVAGKSALRVSMRAALRVLRKGLLTRLPKRKTGRLRRSIRTKVKVEAALSRVTGILSYGAGGAFYGRFLEQGTGLFGPRRRGYAIKASVKKALKIPGLPHPIRRVQIKGIKPGRYLQRTEQGDMNAARRAFSDAWDVEFRRIGHVWKM